MSEKDLEQLNKIELNTQLSTEETTISKQDISDLFNAIDKLNSNIDVLNKMMARANSATRQQTKSTPRPPKVIH